MKRQKWLGIGLIALGIILVIVFIVLFILSRRPEGLSPGRAFPDLPFTGGNRGDEEPETPSGGETSTPNDPDSPSSDGDSVDVPRIKKTLFQITDVPITGYMPVSSEREVVAETTRMIDITDEQGKTTAQPFQEDVITTITIPGVRYHARESGTLHEAYIVENEVQDQKITEGGVANIYRSFFTDDDTMFFQFFDTARARIETYRGTLTKSIETITCPYPFNERLQLGATGPSVEALQKYLGMGTGGFSPGVFDQATLRSVQVFQKQHTLTADGVVGKKTNDLLRAYCQEKEQREYEKRIAKDEQFPYRLSGGFIEPSILQLDPSPDRSQVIKLVDAPRQATASIVSPKGVLDRIVYQENFRDWIIDWAGDSVLSFTTKASGQATGSVFVYHFTRRKLENITEGILGLTTRMSPDGSKMLMSRTLDENEFEFGVVTIAGRRYQIFTVTTFPEKCVWMKDNRFVYCGIPQSIPPALYPDRWYQNEIGFQDHLVRLDTTTGRATVIEDFSDTKTTLDITQLVVSDDETFLFFVDKGTGFLWAKDLR